MTRPPWSQPSSTPPSPSAPGNRPPGRRSASTSPLPTGRPAFRYDALHVPSTGPLSAHGASAFRADSPQRDTAA